jgi:trigger factor
MAREWAGTDRRERKFAVSVTDAGGCKRLLSIEIPRDELESEKALVLTQLRRDLKVPGFRKGKVPVKYIEKNYKEAIRADAVRNLLPSVYEDALVREGIKPVSEPKFDNVKTEEGDTINFDVTVEVRPEVQIEGYRGIKVRVKRTAIEDSNMSDTLEHLRESMATLRVVDREVRGTDFVLIDYGPLLDTGEIDTKLFAANYPVELSGHSLLKEFREGLIGMETGEEKDILVQYPDDFPEKESAGTSKTFRVTVKEIKQKELPELNDDFAKRVGDKFTDLDSLKQQIRADLDKEEDKRVEHEAEEQIIDRLIEKNPFDVPDAMVDNYIASVLEEDRKRRPDVPDEAERERELKEQFHGAAVRTIKKYFILEAVRKQESIEVEAEEVEGKINQLANEGRHQPDEVKAYFKHPQRRQSLENELRDRKILDFLRQSADVKVS